MYVSRHADERTRKRMGIPRSAVKRMAAKAMSEGITRYETHGPLRRYLDALYHYNGTADNMRVWGDRVWIFSGNSLVTVLNLPKKYKNRANGILQTKNTTTEGITNDGFY